MKDETELNGLSNPSADPGDEVGNSMPGRDDLARPILTAEILNADHYKGQDQENCQKLPDT